MDYFRLLSLCSFVYLVAIGRFAVASDWETWHSALPNTPMPKSLFKILQPSGVPIDTKNPDFGIGKSVLKQNDNNLQLSSAFPTAGKDSYSTGPNKHTAPNKPLSLPPRNITTFFLDKDLRSGNTMTLFFPKPTAPPAKFLPDALAGAGPTWTALLPQTLSRFSIEPDSVEAEAMRETVAECEAPGVAGEDKYCAASLRSLVGFGVSRLGQDVEVFATEVGGDGAARRRVVRGVREIGERSVVCHKLNYVHAVFYCHEVHATRAYVVSLAGADGGAEGEEAVAVCHTDTRFWSAELLVFKVLNVKPGTVPVCHFLPNDSLVWVPK